MATAPPKFTMPRIFNVLTLTNLWPTQADPSFGSFVKAQMESLRPLGVDFDVIFVNGRESKWNYLRGIFEVRRQLRAKRYDLIHAHFGLSGWVARWQSRVPIVISFMGDDVLGRPKRNGRNYTSAATSCKSRDLFSPASRLASL